MGHGAVALVVREKHRGRRRSLPAFIFLEVVATIAMFLVLVSMPRFLRDVVIASGISAVLRSLFGGPMLGG